jgi:hypothetical protein
MYAIRLPAARLQYRCDFPAAAPIAPCADAVYGGAAVRLYWFVLGLGPASLLASCPPQHPFSIHLRELLLAPQAIVFLLHPSWDLWLRCTPAVHLASRFASHATAGFNTSSPSQAHL